MPTGETRSLNTYLILRRGGWPTADELRDAIGRSAAVGERMADDVRWLRSYVLSEADRSVGTVCVYEAASPEAIRAHADAADLPVDEIVALAETVLVSPEPVQTP
jgi:Protein of unknown function (DUF4242)